MKVHSTSAHIIHTNTPPSVRWRNWVWTGSFSTLFCFYGERGIIEWVEDFLRHDRPWPLNLAFSVHFITHWCQHHGVTVCMCWCLPDCRHTAAPLPTLPSGHGDTGTEDPGLAPPSPRSVGSRASNQGSRRSRRRQLLGPSPG